MLGHPSYGVTLLSFSDAWQWAIPPIGHAAAGCGNIITGGPVRGLLGRAVISRKRSINV